MATASQACNRYQVSSSQSSNFLASASMMRCSSVHSWSLLSSRSSITEVSPNPTASCSQCHSWSWPSRTPNHQSCCLRRTDHGLQRGQCCLALQSRCTSRMCHHRPACLKRTCLEDRDKALDKKLPRNHVARSQKQQKTTTPPVRSQRTHQAWKWEKRNNNKSNNKISIFCQATTNIPKMSMHTNTDGTCMCIHEVQLANICLATKDRPRNNAVFTFMFTTCFQLKSETRNICNFAPGKL